jgi:DNA recombination protein RmuC
MNTILIFAAFAQLLFLITALVLIFTQRSHLARQLLQGQREGEDRSRVDLLNAQAAFLGTIQTTIRDTGAQQADQLRLFSEQLNRTTLMVDAKLGELRLANDAKLEEMRRTVDEKLQGTLEKRLGDSFKQVSERLEAVFKGLGEMQTLARGVGDLSKVLTNVKTRGTWGEVQLGNLLEQILTPEQFGRNVAVNPNGNARVEFAIKLPGQNGERPVWLPIDAKFPLEDYQRLVEFSEKADVAGVEAAAKALENRVLGQAADIASKYLQPPYSTDFGVLYLPTEGLYAEVLRRPGLAERLQREYRVVVTGPTTIAALLNSLQVGFRTLAIQQRSAEVWEVLGAVKTEFGKFSVVLASIRKKLEAASKEIDETGVRTRAIERKLRDVQALPAAETAALLPELPDVSPENET